ncbi:hypothetical protein [Oryzomonas rubra]|uniref:Uncharacterized protein n=1 Tax=Oryzomonas rubra TaxID=2509454 RepID=A0A5A9XMR8_9BACT|nr:hypothetical protein [Oryzomonas rubra]KAA0894224.1 hypothetical protein ET418_04520 [Oryzomonas rubra]
MEIFRGIADKVNHSVEISGTGGDNDSQVTTTHVAVVRIGNRHVRIKSSEAVLVNNGDRIVVAGSGGRGLFKALAYRNVTTGATGNAGRIPPLFLGSLSIGFGSYFSGPLSYILMLIGAGLIVYAIRIFMAVSKLSSTV